MPEPVSFCPIARGAAGRTLRRLAAIAIAALIVRDNGPEAYAQQPQAVDYVRSIDWSRYEGQLGVDDDDAFGQSLVDVLRNESRYELRWVQSRFDVGDNAPLYPGVPYYWAYTHTAENSDIRPLASFAFGTAAMLATDIYSDEIAGLSRSQALIHTELAIRGVAFAHVANTTDHRHFGGGAFLPPSGGNQSPYHAAQAAQAAWMIWDELSPETRMAVANMVQFEADSFIGYNVRYWKNFDGSTNYHGDTKAEENAWNAQLPALAQAMMPSHPNVGLWREKAAELQISTLSRRSDQFNNDLVNGKPVKDWLGGFNAYDDGLVVNHGRIHPDYIAGSIYLLAVSTVAESLAGQYIPQSNLFNIEQTYRGLTESQFVPGDDKPIAEGGYGTNRPIEQPGGTIFQRTDDGGYTAIVYYPHGNDWGDFPVTDSYLNTDLAAEWLGLDAGTNFDAMGWAAARIEMMKLLQDRPGHDGNIYEPADWNGSGHGADEDFYRSNAVAWLQWWLMRQDRMSPVSDAWGPIPAPEPNSLTIASLAVLLFTPKSKLRRFLTQG